MPWFSRFSRFGDIHFVYSQAGDNACGIACVMMCVFKVNKLTPGRAAITQERRVYDVYSAQSGTRYDGTAYSFATILDDTLNQLNCGQWAAEYVGPDQVGAKIVSCVGTTGGLGPTVDVSPIIVLVGWNNGGAHFVVIDTVRSFAGRTYATVCDPWDAGLRVTRFSVGRTFVYQTGNTYSWNIEGTPQHEYTRPSRGTANGWVVYKVRA